MEPVLAKRLFWAVAVVLVLSAALQQATAALEIPVFESAKLGAEGHDRGFTLSPSQWLGVRFETKTHTEVSSIGGHVAGMLPGRLFVAVFPVDGAMPPSPPSLSDAVFVKTFTAPSRSGEIRIPADFELPPGDWAIVFGSGAAGASGHGAMPGHDEDVGEPGYFLKDGDTWVDGGFGKARFFLIGKPAEKVSPGGSRPAKAVEHA